MPTQAEMAAIRARIAENVARTGWAVQAVTRGADLSRDPPYAYTVGLWGTFGHPELLVIGFDPNLMMGVLNSAGAKVKAGTRFADRDRADGVIREFPVAFRAVPMPHARRWARAASERYRPGRFELLQMFLPDPGGRFPWDAGCSPEYASGQGHNIPLFPSEH